MRVLHEINHMVEALSKLSAPADVISLVLSYLMLIVPVNQREPKDRFFWVDVPSELSLTSLTDLMPCHEIPAVALALFAKALIDIPHYPDSSVIVQLRQTVKSSRSLVDHECLLFQGPAQHFRHWIYCKSELWTAMPHIFVQAEIYHRGMLDHQGTLESRMADVGQCWAALRTFLTQFYDPETAEFWALCRYWAAFYEQDSVNQRPEPEQLALRFCSFFRARNLDMQETENLVPPFHIQRLYVHKA